VQFCERNGVDIHKRELYVSDEDFQALFKMSREDLDSLPEWKKKQLKKKHGIF